MGSLIDCKNYISHRLLGSTSEAARIIYPPDSRSIMVTKGQRLVLECVASGIPTPQVTWAKDGLDLRHHNNTRFLLSNLLIDTTTESDSGTYACHANNGIGSPGTATVQYDVQVFGEYGSPEAFCFFV